METVSVRDLRTSGRAVLQRVADGETLIVTMDGDPIAELRPVAPQLPVYTRNPDDFAGIDGLQVMPVPVPEA